MRVLFLSPRQCWPPLTGAKIREYYLAQALGRRASLTHVSFVQADSPGPRPEDLPFCAELIPVREPPRYTALKVIRGVLGPWPLPVLNYYSGAMNATLESLLDRREFDLIHLDSIHMAGYIPLLERKSRAPIVFDWHNIESEAMSRYSAVAASPARKTYAAVTARRLAEFETYALSKGLGHAVCSAREVGELRRKWPQAQIAVIENGVDVHSFEGPPTASGARTRLVFVGSMNYHPNVDAAAYFARAVWPRVRSRFPGWRFTIVGSNPSSAVLKLANEPGVEVTGTVDDVRRYYREAIAAIVPLRLGGGTRLKVVEAMAAGTPVVSTALGVEGIAVSPRRDILLAGTPEEWLAQLTALADQGALWEELAGAGRELARSRYDWETIGESLFETYRQWLGALTQ